jgi:pentatricopeptide repeat protein
MRLEGVLPNDAALVHGLKACGDSMAAAQGDEIHAEIVKRGSLERHPGVANALIRMYAKSGGTAEAREVLDRLPARNTLLWNALISGHARCARGLAAAAECFEEMQAQGFSPDHVTFLGLLSACGHAGLLDPSRLYLGAMTELCGLLPMQEHYACALDSLARAGSLDEAGRCGMPVDTRRSVVRRSLIAACRSWGNVELGTRAFLRPTLRDRRRQELA